MKYKKFLKKLIFLGIILIGYSVAEGKESASLSLVKVKSLELDNTLNLLKAPCGPKLKNNQIELCSGVKIPIGELNEWLKLNHDQCQEKIISSGFKVFVEKEPPGFDRQKFNQFMNNHQIKGSTFWQDQVVLFKKNSSPLTCVHEYLHVYQWQNGKSNPIAPTSREVLLNSYMDALQKVVADVAQLEKSGSIAQAKELALKAQPYVNRLQEFDAIAMSRDEVDVYATLYESCSQNPKSTICNQSEQELNLAQLLSRIHMLDKSWRDRVQNEIQSLVKGKKIIAAQKVIKNWKKSEWQSALSELFAKPSVDLIKFIKASH